MHSHLIQNAIAHRSITERGDANAHSRQLPLGRESTRLGVHINPHALAIRGAALDVEADFDIQIVFESRAAQIPETIHPFAEGGHGQQPPDLHRTHYELNRSYDLLELFRFRCELFAAFGGEPLP